MVEERRLDPDSLEGYSVHGLTNIVEGLEAEAGGLWTQIVPRRAELRILEDQLHEIQGKIRSLEVLIGKRIETSLAVPLIERRDLLTPEATRLRSAVINVLSLVGDKDSGPFKGELLANPLGSGLAWVARTMLLQASESNTTLSSVDLGDGKDYHLKTSVQLGKDLGEAVLTASAPTTLEKLRFFPRDGFSGLQLAFYFVKHRDDRIVYAVTNLGQPTLSVMKHFNNGHYFDRRKEVRPETALKRLTDIKAALEKVE
ncbi:MAG: hypothetical protein M1142_01745 [Patescibacteria group bacterium]|nr:hypothetical protein [Patescibacteria group bacterium]